MSSRKDNGNGGKLLPNPAVELVLPPPLAASAAGATERPVILDHLLVVPLPRPMRMVVALMSEMSEAVQERCQLMVERYYLFVNKPWLERSRADRWGSHAIGDG